MRSDTSRIESNSAISSGQKMSFFKTLFKAISAKFERLIAEEFTQLSRHLTASI